MWAIRSPKAYLAGRVEALKLQRYQWEAALSPAFATLAAGGWGSGKTTSGLGFLAVSAMLSPPGTAGMAIQPTYDLMNIWLERTLLPAFSGIMRHHDLGRKAIYLPGNRILYYRSGHKPERLQLSDLSYLLLDEPHLMKREIFINAVARAREKGHRLRILLTSLPKIGWLSEEFEDRNDQQRRCLHFRTADNRHVPEEYVSRLKASCPRHMYPAYLEGLFCPTGGAVYAMFDESKHVIPWDGIDHVRMADGSLTRPVFNYVFDWSPRRPHVLWMQRVPKGALMPGGWVTQREVSICVDEIYPDGRYYGGIPTRRLCRIAKSRLKSDTLGGWIPGEAVVDPAGQAVEATSGESDIKQAQEELGVPILFLTGQRIKTGVQHVQLALDPLEGHPFLFFADRLRQNIDPVAGIGDPEKNRERSVLKAMPGYSYKDTTDGDVSDEPFHDNIFSHAADDVRYHCKYYHSQERLSVEAWSAA